MAELLLLFFRKKSGRFCDDETEIVIRLLPFEPIIRVTGPEEFVELIKERLKDQKGF